MSAHYPGRSGWHVDDKGQAWSGWRATELGEYEQAQLALAVMMAKDALGYLGVDPEQLEPEQRQEWEGDFDVLVATVSKLFAMFSAARVTNKPAVPVLGLVRDELTARNGKIRPVDADSPLREALKVLLAQIDYDNLDLCPAWARIYLGLKIDRDEGSKLGGGQ